MRELRRTTDGERENRITDSRDHRQPSHLVLAGLLVGGGWFGLLVAGAYLLRHPHPDRAAVQFAALTFSLLGGLLLTYGGYLGYHATTRA